MLSRGTPFTNNYVLLKKPNLAVFRGPCLITPGQNEPTVHIPSFCFSVKKTWSFTPPPPPGWDCLALQGLSRATTQHLTVHRYQCIN